MVPSEVQVERAIALIQKGGGNYEYFFQQLSNPRGLDRAAGKTRSVQPSASAGACLQYYVPYSSMAGGSVFAAYGSGGT